MSTECRRLWALDLDQTILDTDKVFDEIATVCGTEGITGGQALHEARRATEATGGSFDTFSYLSEAGASDEDLDRVAAIIGENSDNKDYLFYDTRGFLETLQELDEPFLTVTYGSLRTQMPKLRATRLDRHPYIITPTKKKGELIKMWHDGNEYRVHSDEEKVLSARSVVLVDDKAASFGGLPEDSAGYLVQRKTPRKSQIGNIPERVIKVPNLAVITQMLRGSAL